MRNLKITLFYLISFYIIFGCENNLQKVEEKNHFENRLERISKKIKLNKKIYTINRGQKVKIYYTTTTSSNVCMPKSTDFKNIKLINSKLEKVHLINFVGGTILGSFDFIGLNTGVDTIRIKTILPSENCDLIQNYDDFQTHIIIVK